MMWRLFFILLIIAGLPVTAPAQTREPDPGPAAEREDSQQVEESDEAFRRRMELEDARRRDPTYVDPQDGYRRELEKIDRLPEASRDNIREQLIDIIVENGEWSPEDARRDYPYSPSAAAQDDTALASREQEAWDEQIEKYHAREAAAFGAYRGPVSGPGNPDGAEGGAQGGESGAGQDGQQGQSGENGSAGQSGAAGTYQPYQSGQQSADDAASTAGVSESALDYVLGRQTPQSGSAADSSGTPTTPAQQAAQAAGDATATAAPEDASSDAAGEEANTPRDLRGILAIEDLDKLGDSVRPPPPEEDEENPPDNGN
jgi:hypothetical protein